MGLIARLQRLTTSRIETFLSSMEDPETLFPQLVKEMEDQVRAATEGEAKAMTSVKAAQRDVDQIAGKLERLTKGAELAMERGDEATAREAVETQISMESDQKQKADILARCQTALDDAREARKHIQEQLDEVRAKKNEILARARTAKTRKKIERTVHGPAQSSRSILDAVARLESKVDETEAELEVQREMGKGGAKPSLDKRLKELEQSSEIEKRLATLKKKAGGAGA